MSYAFNQVASRIGMNRVQYDDDDDGIIDFDDMFGQEPPPPPRSVYSAADGTVKHADWQNRRDPNDGFGFHLRVTADNGTTFIYAHMDPSRNYLVEGNRVRAGQWIGVYADPANGTATAPHLHFEWRSRTGQPLDPTGFINVVMPNARATSGFMPNGRVHPVLGTLRPHNGIDLAEPRR
jgi:murein DD-endopeptidase MepM/ murein hydrolase activator NlpD